MWLSSMVFVLVWMVQMPFLAFLLTRLVRKEWRERKERRKYRAKHLASAKKLLPHGKKVDLE